MPDIDALICARCGRPMGEHFDMKGKRGAGAWCSIDPDDQRHFVRAALQDTLDYLDHLMPEDPAASTPQPEPAR